MAEVTAPSTTATARASLLSNAESAFSDIGDDTEIVLGKEPESDEPEEDVFGLNAPEGDAESPEDDGEPEEVVEGSKTKPYTVKTLPESFVTLKIDGEEQVVPLREMTDGYMREEAFHKRMRQVNELTEQAKTAATKFQEQSEQFRTSFNHLITSPDELFDFLDDHSPEVLDAVSRKQLQRMMQWQKDPQARMAHEYEKRQKQLEKQRQKLEAERGEYQRTRQEEEAHQKYLAAFKPGYEAGMKRAGYPKVTDELRETVKGLLTARRNATGAEPTAKDVEEAVVRAARAVAAETVAQRKPAPPPAAQAVPGRKPAAPPKQAQKSSKSFNQLFRDLGK